MKKAAVYIFVIATVLIAGCREKNPVESNYPEWIDDVIASIEEKPVARPPAIITIYEYNGQTVFYIGKYGSSNRSTLFNYEGQVICYPDGGWNGLGDGRCDDFFVTRSNPKIIWEDPRGTQ
ncbi:MAG: hypothetical protein K9J12_01850 [Melioribacteraceae bacterium]|nr:hypothetical protein [Melioribacteraceae bacterium]MCF8412895.1 hypothetical protein [Melioribacteraceae bacterium]